MSDDELKADALALYARLGGPGSRDARVVKGLIERWERMVEERDKLIHRYIIPASPVFPTWDVMMSVQRGIVECATEDEAVAYVRRAAGLDVAATPAAQSEGGETR